MSVLAIEIVYNWDFVYFFVICDLAPKGQHQIFAPPAFLTFHRSRGQDAAQWPTFVTTPPLLLSGEPIFEIPAAAKLPLSL